MSPRAELAIKLVATKSWIVAPQFFVLLNEPRLFNIKVWVVLLIDVDIDCNLRSQVDMDGIGTGAYFGEVLGLIDGAEQRGPVFRVPITVIKVME